MGGWRGRGEPTIERSPCYGRKCGSDSENKGSYAEKMTKLCLGSLLWLECVASICRECPRKVGDQLVNCRNDGSELV